MKKVCAMPSILSAQVSNITVVTFEGQVRDAEFEDQLVRQFRELRLTEKSLVLIDLSDVTVLPSTMLGLMASLHKKLQEKLAFCSIGVAVLEQMTVTRLASVFRIYANREEALLKMS